MLFSWCAEFRALSKFSPDALIRVCYFHVSRNVIATVQRCGTEAQATRLGATLDLMTQQEPSPAGRRGFYALLTDLMKAFPGTTWSTEDIVKQLEGTVRSANDIPVTRVVLFSRVLTFNALVM